jgi:uncharacterized surface protein with fasciclin (FAS1) repeats
MSIAQAEHHAEATMIIPETVIDIAIGSDVHTTLVAAVVAADLAGTLSSEGPFTVFAPVNDAFANLPAGTVNMLLEPENIGLLQSILTYHVVPGKVMAGDLTDGLTASSVQGEALMFSYSGNAWKVNDATIVAADLVAGNGVVHVIDSVLMPPMSTAETAEMVYELRAAMDESLEEKVDNGLVKYQLMVMNLSDSERMMMDKNITMAIDSILPKYSSNSDITHMLNLLKYEIMLGNLAANDVVDVAIDSADHTTLVTAVVAAGLVDTLKGDGPFTLFAPVDAAFAKLPAGTVEGLLAQESKADLTNILTYHVVSGAYMASDIRDGLMLRTVNGDALTFTITD